MADTIRFISYNLINGDVNDAHTILTLDSSPEDLAVLQGPKPGILAYVNHHVGIASNVTVSAFGCGGPRVELLNGAGIPCGAVAWGDG